MSHDKVISTFDAWAASGRDLGMEAGHGNVVRQVVEQLDIVAGEKVLDLGCGNGWATRLLAQQNAGVQAIGVDASPKMIARAEELHSFTIRARYDLGRFEELEFKDGHFDRAFSMEALYYAIDLDAALAELFRVLRPGGRADILVDFYAESPATAVWPEQVGLSMQRLSEAEWRARFETAGFVETHTSRVIDTRARADAGPGEHAEHRAAGTLWIVARKPGVGSGEPA